jgi:hypothetical protein
VNELERAFESMRPFANRFRIPSLNRRFDVSQAIGIDLQKQLDQVQHLVQIVAHASQKRLAIERR